MCIQRHEVFHCSNRKRDKVLFFALFCVCFACACSIRCENEPHDSSWLLNICSIDNNPTKHRYAHSSVPSNANRTSAHSSSYCNERNCSPLTPLRPFECFRKDLAGLILYVSCGEWLALHFQRRKIPVSRFFLNFIYLHNVFFFLFSISCGVFLSFFTVAIELIVHHIRDTILKPNGIIQTFLNFGAHNTDHGLSDDDAPFIMHT